MGRKRGLFAIPAGQDVRRIEGDGASVVVFDANRWQ
jgi:hypothetical protein